MFQHHWTVCCTMSFPALNFNVSWLFPYSTFSSLLSQEREWIADSCALQGTERLTLSQSLVLQKDLISPDATGRVTWKGVLPGMLSHEDCKAPFGCWSRSLLIWLLQELLLYTTVLSALLLCTLWCCFTAKWCENPSSGDFHPHCIYVSDHKG